MPSLSRGHLLIYFRTVNSTKYIGMDIHKETISIAVMNAAGKVVMECVIETKANTVLQFIHGLRGDLHVTFERALAEALNKDGVTDLRTVAASVGLSSTRRFYKDFRHLRLAIVAKNREIRKQRVQVIANTARPLTFKVN